MPSNAVGEISQSSDDLSKRTEHQAASLEETAAELDQIPANVSLATYPSQKRGVILNLAKAFVGYMAQTAVVGPAPEVSSAGFRLRL
ncbi:hypothetical protein [Rhizobium indigoferae]|uniref:Uncharacterized protein n=1 Tax=Rhizobium indigoferae TaxID=158891 RepID=A0ABZ1DSX9_9HYPH|nr:hypothetical protein [Rhizobium indigoferae]NNU52543.1 hypothetical protein [Rhizobium indigoferae]WRW39313.1 hypothetical protein U5G49_006383 [Rhizobium indigoferae]